VIAAAGSVMLAYQLLVPIGMFAPQESGRTEVWYYKNGSLLGVEPSDPEEQVEMARRMAPEILVRTFAYRGTAADRNTHRMTGQTR